MSVWVLLGHPVASMFQLSSCWFEIKNLEVDILPRCSIHLQQLISTTDSQTTPEHYATTTMLDSHIVAK